MSKKSRKEAIKRLCDNDVTLRWCSEALDLEKKMTRKERKTIIRDMFERYFDENDTDSFTVNVLGLGHQKGSSIFSKDEYRMDDFDEDYGVPRRKNKLPRSIDDLVFK